MRRLESVASTRQLLTSPSARTRRIALDIALCFGLPVVQLALRYITQGHRYDIIEHIGCQIPAYMSWPNVVITSVIPLLLAIGATIYACKYPGLPLTRFFAEIHLISFGFPLVPLEAAAIQGGPECFSHRTQHWAISAPHCIGRDGYIAGVFRYSLHLDFVRQSEWHQPVLMARRAYRVCHDIAISRRSSPWRVFHLRYNRVSLSGILFFVLRILRLWRRGHSGVYDTLVTA